MSNKTTITAERGQPIMQIERIFDAPRKDVFEIFTTQEMLEKWWSPYDQAYIEIDAREGGRWHFTAGKEVNFYGVIHEFSAPERFVQTEEFGNTGERGHVALDRYEFAELPDGKTKMTLTTTFLSVADRDFALQSGMEVGIIKSHETIDTLLKTI
jgi:uncharacterized protein YndB with AHSA1/START domain